MLQLIFNERRANLSHTLFFFLIRKLVKKFDMKLAKVTYPAREKPRMRKLPKFVQIPDSLLNPVPDPEPDTGPRLDPDSVLCLS